MKTFKNIELFIKCKKLLFPNRIWRFIYYIHPRLKIRKKSRYINLLKDFLREETEYYEEALYLLLDLLKSENRISEIIHYYNISIQKYKSQGNNSKAIILYKLLINYIKNQYYPFLVENDKETLLIKYYLELAEILSNSFEYDEAIYYLEIAKQIYHETNCFSGVENISIKISTILILNKEYSRAVQCLDKLIKYKPRYSFNKKDIRIILLYFLSLLTDYLTSNELRGHLENIKHYYKNIYECEEYLFIINMISCVENADLNHFTHEVHHCSFHNDPIYIQIFIDIHKNIVKNCRKLSYDVV